MNIDALIAQLTQAHTALGDIGDCKSDNDKAAYWTTYTLFQRTIGILRNHPRDLARARERLAGYDEQRQAIVAHARELEQLLISAPNVADIRNRREQDREHDRQRDLRRALEHLRAGTLLRAPGVTYARVEDLEQDIAKWQTTVTRLEAELNAHVQAAETLLGATASSVAVASAVTA